MTVASPPKCVNQRLWPRTTEGLAATSMPGMRRDPEQRKIVRRDEQRVGDPAARRRVDIHADRIERRHVDEAAVLRAIIEILRVRADAVGIPAAARCIDVGQLLRPLHRQRPQEHGLEERENRGRRADAERQREGCGGREPGAAAKNSRAVPEVLAKLLDPEARPDVTSLVLVFLNASELEPRAPLGLAGRNALAPQVFRARLDMERQLVGEIAVELPAFEETRQPEPGSRPHVRQISRGRVSSAAVMARARRFHPAVSSLSRRRPFGVSW
jgi:hypothetical protein